MSIFTKYMKPTPHIEKIQDPKRVKTDYRYWRLRILYASFIGYAIYYFTRGTLALSMPELKRLGYDEVHLGWMISAFQVAYGISKFVSGILADRANPRYFMAFGLMMTGVVTIFFGLTTSSILFIVLWTLNGWFQGYGSAPCHRLLTHWYSTRERGRWWSLWNTSHNVGAAIIPLIGAYLLLNYGWESVMIVPGIIAIITSFYLINRLRDTPQSLGLPPIEVFRGESPMFKGKECELSYREILFSFVLKNKWMWFLALTYFMVYVIRWTISHWAFYFLVEARDFDAWAGARCLLWYEVGGFLGGISAGWLSDLAFKGKRAPVNLIYFLALIPCIYGFSILAIQSDNILAIQVIIGLTGFFVFGPQMLLAVHAAEVSHKKAAATAVGFLGIIAYVGAASTGGPLSYIVKHAGWEAVFTLMGVCAIVGAISVIPLFYAKDQRSLKK